MQYLLLSYGKSGFVNAPQFTIYVHCYEVFTARYELNPQLQLKFIRGIGTGSSRSTSVSSCQYDSTNAPYPSFARRSYQMDREQEVRKPSAVIRNYIHELSI